VSLYKLMAYKDEYEVARLYTESGFFDKVGRQFEGDYSLRFHLAPPLFSKRNDKGHLVKQSFGPWMATAFRWLSKAKALRGTPFDPFGYTSERRGERSAIGEFQALMRQIADELTPERLSAALALARLPQSVRGFGHVKERNHELARAEQSRLLAAYKSTSTQATRVAA